MKRAESNLPLEQSLSHGVLTLTLRNPPANALSLEVIARLQAALESCRNDPAVRVIVLAADGKVFSGGHDLKELTAHRRDEDGGREFFQRTFDACTRMMLTLSELRQPVIAAIDGIATAAGCQLVAACDLAICSDRSTFGVNGINVGLFCSTPAVALAGKINPRHALEMLLTGEMIDAAQAREFGLVNRVVPPEYLGQIVARYASAIASKSPLAIGLGKQGFYARQGLSTAEAYDQAGRTMVENLLSADAEEGIAAFFGKRKPEWRGE